MWVWSVWGASIITYSMIQVRVQENYLLPLWLWDPAHKAGVAFLWLPATVEGAETLYICMKKTSYEYEVYEVPQS
jgi:hypothetical protein